VSWRDIVLRIKPSAENRLEFVLLRSDVANALELSCAIERT
jgi:hypothetical protein